MTTLDQLQSTLNAHLRDHLTAACVRRGNELHVQITQGDALHLAQVLRRDYKTELVLMVANDRRAERGGFEVHYLFANNAENWFVRSGSKPSAIPHLRAWYAAQPRPNPSIPCAKTP